MKTITPVDGSVYATRELARPAEVEGTLARAAAAQREWRAVPVAERAAFVRRMVEAMAADADGIAEELAWQMGRPVAHGPLEILRGFPERADHMAGIAPACLADIPCEPKDGFERFIRREALGVVLVVAPWNYPFLSSVNGLVPALLAGNAVVLKVASQTPLVAERYADAFQAAGLPEGVFQFVHADHETVARIIGDARVGFVAFTGSVPGGRDIEAAAAASPGFIATNLELGGKDPAYVRADCAVEATVAELADGAFFNAGQSCCGVERVYVHRSVYDEIVEGLVEAARSLVLGNPLDRSTTLGPMVRTSAADLVRKQVADAVASGARALVPEAGEVGTPYLGPQVLVDVDHTMRVMTEETFGPVVGVMPVADDDEAVRLMNDSVYGLSASVWTSDVDAAVALGDRVETGTWYMNRCDYLDPALAWVGVKDSGRGVSLSPLAFEAVTRPKSFHLRTELR